MKVKFKNWNFFEILDLELVEYKSNQFSVLQKYDIIVIWLLIDISVGFYRKKLKVKNIACKWVWSKLNFHF